MITHGIKPQCWTTLGKITQGIITQGKIPRIKSLSKITHVIIAHCRTTLGKITQGKITQYDYPWYYTPVPDSIGKDYLG